MFGLELGIFFEWCVMSSCKLQVWLILVIHRHLRTGPCFCNMFFFFHASFLVGNGPKVYFCQICF